MRPFDHKILLVSLACFAFSPLAYCGTERVGFMELVEAFLGEFDDVQKRCPQRKLQTLFADWQRSNRELLEARQRLTNGSDARLEIVSALNRMYSRLEKYLDNSHNNDICHKLLRRMLMNYRGLMLNGTWPGIFFDTYQRTVPFIPGNNPLSAWFSYLGQWRNTEKQWVPLAAAGLILSCTIDFLAEGMAIVLPPLPKSTIDQMESIFQGRADGTTIDCGEL